MQMFSVRVKGQKQATEGRVRRWDGNRMKQLKSNNKKNNKELKRDIFYAKKRVFFIRNPDLISQD